CRRPRCGPSASRASSRCCTCCSPRGTTPGRSPPTPSRARPSGARSPTSPSGSRGSPRLLDDEPGARGLLALLLLQHARRDERVRPDGVTRTRAEQARARWRHDEIAEGTATLEAALAAGRPGPYQVQAAIAALHDAAPDAAATDRAQILGLYDVL